MNTIKSILQKDKFCYLCWLQNGMKKTEGLDVHHVMNGNGLRAQSEKWGGTIYLCRYHHDYVHKDAGLRKQIKKIYQTNFELLYGHDLWMNTFHKNYKEEE